MMSKRWSNQWKQMPYQRKLKWSEQFMRKGHIKDMTPVQVMIQVNQLASHVK